MCVYRSERKYATKKICLEKTRPINWIVIFVMLLLNCLDFVIAIDRHHQHHHRRHIIHQQSKGIATKYQMEEWTRVSTTPMYFNGVFHMKRIETHNILWMYTTKKKLTDTINVSMVISSSSSTRKKMCRVVSSLAWHDRREAQKKEDWDCTLQYGTKKKLNWNWTHWTDMIHNSTLHMFFGTDKI